MVWELTNPSYKIKTRMMRILYAHAGLFLGKKVALIPATMQNLISVPQSAHLRLRLRRFGDPATVHLF